MLVLGLEDLSVPWRILIGAVLLVDGRLHKSTLEMLQEEAAISLIVETLWQDRFSNIRLQRIFLELLYEMCRIQKIPIRELQKISKEFLEFLFSVVENKAGYDTTDPYNMAAMKVILALNEQYMIAVLSGHSPDESDEEEQEENANQESISLRNKTFDILKKDGDMYRAFGENMVFIFNRGADKCIQLMMLKLLYLIFTTKETFQYMYLNDLKVVVGVIIRELHDLPFEEEDLRNTYLRILHPLLQNTQIRYEQYKKDELLSLLEVFANPSCANSHAISENTQRLAYRCLRVDWLGYCSPIISPITSLSEQNTGVSIETRSSSNSEYIDRKQTSSVPLIEMSPVTSISSASSSTTDVTEMPKLRHSSSHNHLLVTHHKRPPRPSPRKLQAMQIRNTSAIEVATLVKTHTPPPPPPRHRNLSLPGSQILEGRPSSTPPPPPRPRMMRIGTPVGPCP
ncbi:Ldb17p [Sugiyamaella lignohabitans]|uniref:Ldb17p n=1 Tax=Sugiyamaella lignohabitans TaxID=796027 RepID=A0A167CLQ7_9ASCO|nr:Ldb17p [Sugiyamaella lignohabitans]ANB11864.1 Ldb17p [Sugiyamaella lignohabitans]